MRSLSVQPVPVALACALFEDAGRFLFLEKTDANGRVILELPCVLVFAGDEPVSKLAALVRSELGLDAFIGEVVKQGNFNAGSRKRKRRVPALGFHARAKNLVTRARVRWVKRSEFSKWKRGKTAEWL